MLCSSVLLFIIERYSNTVSVQILTADQRDTIICERTSSAAQAVVRSSCRIFEISVYTCCRDLSNEMSHRRNILDNKAGRRNMQGMPADSDA